MGNLAFGIIPSIWGECPYPSLEPIPSLKAAHPFHSSIMLRKSRNR